MFSPRPERNLLREGLTKAGVETSSEWTLLVTTTPTGELEVEGATMIDVSTAKALHDRKVPFVDTRGRIAAGRILRTHILNYFDAFEEAQLLEIAAKTQEIVIYGPAETRYVAKSCAKAVAWGFERVYCFVAGFEEWRQAGYPIEKGN